VWTPQLDGGPSHTAWNSLNPSSTASICCGSAVVVQLARPRLHFLRVVVALLYRSCATNPQQIEVSGVWTLAYMTSIERYSITRCFVCCRSTRPDIVIVTGCSWQTVSRSASFIERRTINEWPECVIHATRRIRRTLE